MTMKLTEEEFQVLLSHGRVLDKELFRSSRWPDEKRYCLDCRCHGCYWLIRGKSGLEAMWHDQLPFYANDSALRNILYLEGF